MIRKFIDRVNVFRVARDMYREMRDFGVSEFAQLAERERKLDAREQQVLSELEQEEKVLNDKLRQFVNEVSQQNERFVNENNGTFLNPSTASASAPDVSQQLLDSATLQRLMQEQDGTKREPSLTERVMMQRLHAFKKRNANASDMDAMLAFANELRATRNTLRASREAMEKSVVDQSSSPSSRSSPSSPSPSSPSSSLKPE